MYIDQKFDLIQQIHREQSENEKSFYRTYNYKDFDYKNSGNQIGENENLFLTPSFRLRFLLAILIFLVFFLMEQKGIAIEGIGCSEIVEYISYNYKINM